MMDYLTNYVSLPADSFEAIIFIVTIALKISLLLIFVLLFCRCLRLFSAATRHFLLTLGVCAAFIIPFLSLVKIIEAPIFPLQLSTFSEAIDSKTPDLRAIDSALKDEAYLPSGVLPYGEYQKDNSSFTANETTPSFTVENSGMSGFTSVLRGVSGWLIGIWIIGVSLFLFRSVTGLVITRKLARAATRIDDTEWEILLTEISGKLNLKGKISLRRSTHTNTPIVCGFWNSTILLPTLADKWSTERRRVVLLHELAHVARRDCLTQFIAQIACAFYWFNPFVWYAARQMRIEREQACDDMVLIAGTTPSDYAQHLLEIARSLQVKHSMFEWTAASSVALVRKSQVEERLTAILNARPSRVNPNKMIKTVLALSSFIAVFSLSALQFSSEAKNIVPTEKRENIDAVKDDYQTAPDFTSSATPQNEYAQFFSQDKNKSKKRVLNRKEIPGGLINQNSVKNGVSEDEKRKLISEQDARAAGYEERLNRLNINLPLLKKLKQESKSKVELTRQKALGQLDELMSKERAIEN